MKLKCIGGPSDGDIIELSASYRDVRVVDPKLPLHSDWSSVNPDSVPATVSSVGYTVYTRRILRQYENGELRELQYLAPADVSDINALRPLLCA